MKGYYSEIHELKKTLGNLRNKREYLSWLVSRQEDDVKSGIGQYTTKDVEKTRQDIKDITAVIDDTKSKLKSLRKEIDDYTKKHFPYCYGDDEITNTIHKDGNIHGITL